MSYFGQCCLKIDLRTILILVTFKDLDHVFNSISNKNIEQHKGCMVTYSSKSSKTSSYFYT